MENRWYGTLLRGDELKAYELIRDGFLHCQKEIVIPRMQYSRVSEIAETVRLDDPMIFYVSGLSYRITELSKNMTVLVDYGFEKKQISEMTCALGKRIERILTSAASLEHHRHLLYIRDWIFDNVIYKKLKRQYSHEIYGVLSHGIGVCEGIAKTVKVMCDHIGIPAVVVIGKADEDNGIRHAWNVISMYGKYRHYDFTFDLAVVKSGQKPRYYGVDDGKIFLDHNMPVYEIPEAGR